jgi:para-nitrobenzyl esterase
MLALSLASGRAADSEPVRTDDGLVSSVSGRNPQIRVFKGIPFAAPPTGERRWKEPQPVVPWTGVRSGDRFGPRCMQPSAPTGVGDSPAIAAQPMSEDCLYLNVWTAAAPASERRPVVVWAHGGAFSIGAGSLPEYDGERLASQGVVVVTVNYRLGPFGFFAHPELTRESGRRSSGNYGVMDFVAALQWVQRNIAAFGGDPDRVTAVGQSAGGYLVHYAMSSSRIPKLFRRAVVQSAPVRLQPELALSAAEAVGQSAAQKIGAHSLGELRSLPATQVSAALPPLRPIVDGWLRTEDMWSSARAGRVKAVDLLIGANKDEGTFPYLRARDLGLGPMSADEFAGDVRQRFGSDANAFLTIYPVRNEAEKTASQLAAFSDEAAWQARFFARAAAATGAKSYLYSFVHEPPVAAGAVNRGATHTAEIAYMFNNPQPPWTDVDRRLADRMSSYWLNFVRTGDPNGAGLPPWPVFVAGSGERLMRLGSRVEAAPTLDSRRIQLFDRLLTRLLPIREITGP